jgi:hypothetical protein
MRSAPALAVLLAIAGGAPRPCAETTYPMTQTFEAQVTSGSATITSAVTVRVDRLMEESRRVRVTDALRYGGYANFVQALRSLPAVGLIALDSRSVEIRYAHEEASGEGRRLLLLADRPLFFIGDPARSRAGYELTIVDLRFDAQGHVTGRMTGAARVKPSPDGVQLDDFAGALVHLTPQPAQP